MKFETVVIGDTTKVLTVEIGGLTNLDAVNTIAVNIWHPGLVATTIPATIVSSSARTISFDIAPFLIAGNTQPLKYNVEYELTYLSGLKETWPPEPDQLPVRAQAGDEPEPWAPSSGADVEWELYAEWTLPGTYNNVVLPSGTVAARFAGCSSGAGGGSGRKGPGGTTRGGGGAASSGQSDLIEIDDPVILAEANVLTIVIPAGGTGGAPVTANGTDGNNGTNGSAMSITGATSGVILRLTGGAFGSGGTTTGGTGGAARVGPEGFLGAGAAGSSGVGANATGTHRTPSGGGGGGGIGSGNTPSAGGNGGPVNNLSATGAVGGAVGTDGAPGPSPTAVQRQNFVAMGAGGAGGGAGSGGDAGDGGAGGYPGGGGGGGGAAVDAVGNSGAGGPAGDGWGAIWVLVPV